MRIVSWNVNGLRACAKKGFADFLGSSGAEIVCVQEVRAFADAGGIGLTRGKRVGRVLRRRVTRPDLRVEIGTRAIAGLQPLARHHLAVVRIHAAFAELDPDIIPEPLRREDG